MTEREMKKVQEDGLFENFVAQEFVKAGKAQSLQSYLEVGAERSKNGMSNDEIDAVRQRAVTAFNAWKS